MYRTHLLVLILLCTPGFSGAQIVETWQSRIVKSITELEEIEDRHAPARLRLSAERSSVTQQGATLREQVTGQRKRADEICRQNPRRDCLNARTDAQEAHLDLTENVHARLQVEARIVQQNFDYSLQMANVLAGVLEDLEKSLKRSRPSQQSANRRAIEPMEVRANRFLDKALPTLQSAVGYTHEVARSSQNKARMAGARDVVRAIKRFRQRFERDAAARTPVGRLALLRARFEAFAAINKQARHAIDATGSHLRGVNAVAATTLVESMVASHEGGLAAYGREFTQNTESALAEFAQDIDILYEGLGVAAESESESFFEDGDDSFFVN